ncbi:peptide ABC transporter substrate-binding protein [Effusibacillus consociatus]|uniref:Peptide ABC transporter substrate-binding protein n=1 Tax=Effusibacillus consociatus TaxID=1117041 RepID=A0ABV9Q3D9_9BACL
MKAKKWLATAVALTMAGSLVVGCSTTTGDPGKDGKKKEVVISTNEPGEIPSIDPALAKDSQSSWVIDHVMEGLYFQDKDGLKPGQAKEHKVSADGITYTFTLKDGLKWSNGDAVTAHDFEFAWKRVLDPATASEYAYIIADYIKGGKEYNSADAKKEGEAGMKKLRDAVGVKALDDKTLEVQLAAPTPFFLQLVSYYTYYPVPKKVVESNAKWAAEANTYVSNGPFKVVEWAKDKRLVAAKNENYWSKDTITADKIIWNNLSDDNTAWQMYQNGELNMFRAVPPAATEQALKTGEMKPTPQLATYFYRFNVTKPPFNNVKVRKAFAMAIDRKAIIDNVTKAGQKPAYAFVSPGIKAPDGKDFREAGGNAFFKEDANEAKKLLEEGLKELGMSSMPKITLTYNTNEGHKKIAEAIQEMWKKNLGVEVELQNAEWKVYLDKVHKLDYQVARAGWIGDYLDPITFIDMFVTKGDNNETGWSNPKYDELVVASKKEQDQKKRDQMLHDAEKILMDEMPIMPIYFYTHNNAYKPELQGYYQPANREPVFRYATIK